MGCSFIKNGIKYSSIDEIYSSLGAIKPNGSIMDIKKIGELLSIPINENSYTDDQVSILSELVTTLDDISKEKTSRVDGVVSILEKFTSNNYIDKIQSEVDKHNKKFRQKLDIGESILNAVELLKNDKSIHHYGENIRSVAEWIYNIDNYIKSNSSVIAQTITTPLNSSDSSITSDNQNEIIKDEEGDVVVSEEEDDTSVITPENTVFMNNEYFGETRLKNSSRILTRSVLNLMPYSNIINIESTESISESISKVYDDFINGKVMGYDLNNSSIKVVRNGEKVLVSLSNVTREDAINTNSQEVYNFFTLYNIYKSVLKNEDGSIENDMQVKYLLSLAVRGVDIEKTITNYKNGLVANEGGRKNFNNDNNDSDNFISKDLKFIFENIPININAPASGFLNGKQVVEFFKYIKSEMLFDGESFTDYKMIGEYIRGKIDENKFGGAYKMISKSIYDALFKIQDISINQNLSSITASVIQFAENSDSILKSINDSSFSTEDKKSLTYSAINKANKMTELINAISTWFNSNSSVQYATMNVDGTVKYTSPISSTLDANEHTGNMKAIWGIGNSSETNSLSPALSSYFFGNKKGIIISGNSVTLKTQKDSFTFNMDNVKVFNDDIAIDVLKSSMEKIGYTDIGFMFNEIIQNVARKFTYVGGRKIKYSEVNANSDYKKFLEHLIKVEELARYDVISLSYIEKIDNIANDNDIDALQKKELIKSLKAEYKNKLSESNLKINLPHDLERYGIKVYTPAAYYKDFFSKYVNSVKNNSNVLIASQTKDGSGNMKPFFTIQSSFSSFIYGQKHIDKQFENTAKTKLGKLNSLINGDITVENSFVNGGLESDNGGKSQKELSTAEFLDSYFNSYLVNNIVDNRERLTMVAFNDMMADRPMSWITNYKYKNDLFTFSKDKGVLSDLTPNESNIVKAFKDIAKMYNQRKRESLNFITSQGLLIRDGFIVKQESIDSVRIINVADKADYFNLTKNYHYRISKDGSLMAGNSITFENSSIPVQLIDSLLNNKASYSDIVKLYTQNEVDKLVDVLVDNKVSIRGFSNFIDTDIESINSIVETNLQSNKKAGIKTREDYKNAILRSKELSLLMKTNYASIKDNESTLSDQEKQGLLESIQAYSSEKIILQANIDIFKKELSKVLSTNHEKFKDLNPILEYAVYSHLILNTFTSELSRDGSFHNNSITDYVKRGQGVTAPFMQTPKTDNGIGSFFNVIYREDSPGQYMDKYDSELHSNGEVIFSPLTWLRIRKDSGGDLSFMGYSGIVKTNYFNSGTKEGMHPGYWKMSGRTITSYDLSIRSKQSIDAMKIFFDKDIFMMSKNGTVNAINLFRKYEKDLLNSKTEKQLVKVLEDMNKYVNDLSSGTNTFSESQDMFNPEYGLYELLNHAIVPTSAAKMFQTKIHSNTLTSTEVNDEQFGYTLPMINPFGMKSNSSQSMVRVSTDGFGIQNNKQHDIKPAKKGIPNQILRFLGINNPSLFSSITSSISKMTDVQIAELNSLIGSNRLISHYKKIAYANSFNSNSSSSRIDLIGDPNTITVVSKELTNAIMRDFKNSVKPDMVGGTFVQRASNIHVYEKDGNISFANEIGLNDDYEDAEGYTRRRLRPFGYMKDGKFIRSKQELIDILKSDPTSLTPIHQEVIMDFPYRKEFHIGKNQSLNEIMNINGVSFQDGQTILTKKELISKLDKLVNGNTTLTGDAKVLADAMLSGSLVDMFINNKQQYAYFKTLLEKTNNISKLKELIADYYIELNKALYVYPIRIPTTGMASGFPSKIVGFASNIENTIIVPSEKSILDGSDYDIDELHTFYKPLSVGWNENTIGLQNQIFDSIFSSYMDMNNANDILTEITYADIVSEQEKKINLDDDRSNVNSVADYNKIRQDLYDGNKLVGYEVKAQQSLLDIYITNTIAKDESLNLSFLNTKFETIGVSGINIAMDVMSSYVNMATDNGKLGGILGELGHDGKLSPLVLGLAINGFEGIPLTYEEARLSLSNRITDLITNQVVKDVLVEVKSRERIKNGKSYPLRFDEELFNKLNSLIEKSDTSESDKKIYTDIKNALVLGTQSYRSYQLDLMQADMSSTFDVYNKVKSSEFILGSTLDSFIQNTNTDRQSSIDSQISFVNANSDFEKAVRNVFDIQNYAKQNKMKVSHLNMLSLVNKTLNDNIKILSEFNNLERDYFKRIGTTNKSTRSEKFTQEQYDAFMSATESLMITKFIKESSRYNYSIIELPIYDKDGNEFGSTTSSYDLSNYNEILRFHTDFPKYIEILKQNNVTNAFVSNLAIFSSGSNKRHVSIRGAAAIDDGSIIDDLKRDYDRLPNNEKKNIAIYALLTGGFNMNKSSLIRFIDNQILKDYSMWENSFDDTIIRTPHIKSTDMGNGISSFSDDDFKRYYSYYENINMAIQLTNTALQVKMIERRKGEEVRIDRIGYYKNPSFHTGRYAATYVGENEVYSLRTPPKSKILSDESISKNGRLVNLTPAQERLLRLGNSIEIDFVDGFLDKPKTSYPRTYSENNPNYNDTAYNTVKIKETNVAGKYIVEPTSKSMEDTEYLQQLNIPVVSSFVDNVVVTNNEITNIDSNGNLLLGTSDNIISKRMVSVYGLIPNLKTNTVNQLNEQISKISKELSKNSIFANVVKHTIGLSANENTIRSFMSVNYTRELINDAFINSRNSVEEFKNLSNNEIIIQSQNIISDKALNSFKNYVALSLSNFVNGIGISKDIVEQYLSGVSGFQMSLMSVAQIKLDDQFINNKFIEFPQMKPSNFAIKVKENINKQIPLNCNL